MKKFFLILCVFFAALFCPLCPALAYVDTDAPGLPRALLIGVEHFADAEDAYPAASRNVHMLRETLQNGLVAGECITLPEVPPHDAESLRALLSTTFAESRADDLCMVYICTHGRLQRDGTPVLLLSDGIADAAITPAMLERAFDGIRGHILLILDTCYSGAFIGKGMEALPETLYFRDGRFSVLTASGGSEESWYYLDGFRQGSFYFTELLTQGLSAAGGTPCDLHRDGEISLSDLHRYLSSLSGTSHPQCYPQQDDTPLFYYDAARPLPDGPYRDAIQFPAFRNVWLTDDDPVTVAFTMARPARVAYQIVPWRGSWDFAQASLYYDTAESEGAPDAYRGYLTPGRKSRSFTIDVNTMLNRGGYLLFQLLSVNEQEDLRVHASRVLGVPARDPLNRIEKFAPTLTVQQHVNGECQITVRYPSPCVLTLYLVTAEGQRICPLSTQETALPFDAIGGQVFYLDALPSDAARVEAVLDFGSTAITLSEAIRPL